MIFYIQNSTCEVAMKVRETRARRAFHGPIIRWIDQILLETPRAVPPNGIFGGKVISGLATDLLPELPFDTEIAGDTRIRGTVDLLGLSQDGREAVIIDYKSPAPVSPLEAAQPYLAQLGTYVSALSVLRPEMRLVRAGIHFLGSGTLAWGSPSV